MIYREEFGFEGDICPYPMVKAIRTIEEYIKKIKNDEITNDEVQLSFLVDHMPAARSIPDGIRRRNYGGFRMLKAKGKPMWRIDIQLLRERVKAS